MAQAQQGRTGRTAGSEKKQANNRVLYVHFMTFLGRLAM
jgi:hypothetical protein